MLATNVVSSVEVDRDGNANRRQGLDECIDRWRIVACIAENTGPSTCVVYRQVECSIVIVVLGW
jgi:hypothetical protein